MLNRGMLQEQYDRFHYTALLYLNTYVADFEGGRFMFDTPGLNNTVHPKAGMMFCWSGKLDWGVSLLNFVTESAKFH